MVERGRHSQLESREGALLEVLATSAVLVSCGLSLPASGLSFLAGQEAVSAEAQPGREAQSIPATQVPSSVVRRSTGAQGATFWRAPDQFPAEILALSPVTEGMSCPMMLGQ